MEESDIDSVGAASAAAFEFEVTDPDRWRARFAHCLRTDPDGVFVAERDGRVIGASAAVCRERLWCLSLLAVDPRVQSSGAGRALLECALSYRSETDCGLIVSSNDPRALRLYATAGFELRPTFEAIGPLHRRRMPAPDPRVDREDGAELEALESISRELRGGPHTAELEQALKWGGRLLRIEDRGFAVVYPGEGVWLLAARDEDAAAALMRTGLVAVGETPQASVRWITAGQDWAIDVLLDAGLRLGAHGALCVSGEPGSLQPFIPSPPYA